MKLLLLGRHAKANEGKPDPSLLEEGEIEASEMAYKIEIAIRGLSLTIWCSTAKRAKETAYIIKKILEESGIVVTIEFFDELWSDKTHAYKDEWVKEHVPSFQGDALLILAHAEISEYAVSLGSEYILLKTGECMVVKKDYSFKI